MLNRRVLRVKAMQALYSYFMAQGSLKDVIREQLEAQFYPDPAKDDFSESDKFTDQRKTASRLFNESLSQRQVNAPEGTDIEIINAVEKSITNYYEALKQEERNIRSRMLTDVRDLFKLYLKLVLLPVEFSHLERLEKEKKEKAHINRKSPWQWQLQRNPVIDHLTKDEAFNKAIIDNKISWSSEIDILRSWYKDIFKADEEIKSYQYSESLKDEDHKNILIHLFKKIIFKNESINETLSEADLFWTENKTILRSLVVKTFKDYEADLDPPIQLKEISKNQEEDFDFFKDLYDHTIKESVNFDKLITEKIKNWDISRVAILDRIILKMALSEMMLFHGIPVKVTINEFIEISKQYSTPKSKQFVNGILDVMANELTSEGVIKKSGRGLIDNK